MILGQAEPSLEINPARPFLITFKIQEALR